MHLCSLPVFSWVCITEFIPTCLINIITNGQHSLKLFLILIEEILLIKRNGNVDTTYPSGAPEYTPVFGGVRVLYLSCMCMFCRSLLVFLYFFFLPFCCLFFDIRILITTLISSNRVCNKINTTGATRGAGTAYPSGAPKIILVGLVLRDL